MRRNRKKKNLCEERFGIFLPEAEKTQGFDAAGIGYQNKLIVRIADSVNSRSSHRLGYVVGAESDVEGVLGLPRVMQHRRKGRHCHVPLFEHRPIRYGIREISLGVFESGGYIGSDAGEVSVEEGGEGVERRCRGFCGGFHGRERKSRRRRRSSSVV